MSDLINGLGNGLNTSATSYTSKATSALENKLEGSDLSNATDEELMEVCKDFEAYFVEQMFRAMEKMSHITDDDEEEDGAISSGYATQMREYFQDEMLSKYAENAADSNNGSGLGIAQMLYEQMKRNYNL